MPTSIYNHQSMKNRRRFLRKNQTEAEKMIWDKVRGKRIAGYKFLRQYSVGPYILVLRFWNNEISDNLDNALVKIQTTIKHRAGDPSLAIREGLHDSEGDEL